MKKQNTTAPPTNATCLCIMCRRLIVIHSIAASRVKNAQRGMTGISTRSRNSFNVGERRDESMHYDIAYQSPTLREMVKKANGTFITIIWEKLGKTQMKPRQPRIDTKPAPADSRQQQTQFYTASSAVVRLRAFAGGKPGSRKHDRSCFAHVARVISYVQSYYILRLRASWQRNIELNKLNHFQ